MHHINYESLFDELWPICRSITGNGVRTTLNIINNYVSIDIDEVPSGTECFDWTIPDEWNVNIHDFELSRLKAFEQ
jgi:aminopeptidase-like protein